MIRRRGVPVADLALRRARYEAAFGEVYEPLQRYLLRRATPADAQDALAEALTVLWRRLDDVPADAVLPWCFGVARRCLANQRRGAERGARLAERVGSALPPIADQWQDGPDLDPDPDLDAALAELDPDDRELLRLWAWEELQPREIAVVLGVSANAVSIRLHRARQRLWHALGGKNPMAAGQEVGGDTHTRDVEDA